MSKDIKLPVLRFLLLFTAMLFVAVGLAALSHSTDPAPAAGTTAPPGK
jgi:hypothetical protein